MKSDKKRNHYSKPLQFNITREVSQSKNFFIPSIVLLLNIGGETAGAHKSSDPPNILWFTIEDISPNLGAYGDTYAHTPNLDEFASQAMRYDIAWSTSPVCAPSRTAIITGIYPATTGGLNHRSQVGLPGHIRMYPQLLREHGYYVTNNAKKGYNVIPFDGNNDYWHESSSEAHYLNRPDKETPFFAVFNCIDSHGSRIRLRTDLPYHDPDLVPIPPFHPDTPEVRRDWAQYYHSITVMDDWFGEWMKRIHDEGLMENTIIFVYSDHGGGMPTYKQLAYNRGLQVPLLVYIPEKYRYLASADYKEGGNTRRLVEFVDFAPTLLSLIGVEPPQWMQGRAFMGSHAEEPRKYVFGSRGRVDERIDMVRSVRDQRYIYIRNYMPHLKHGYFSQYMFTFNSTKEWRDLYYAGKLVPPQTYVWESKPPEELYDLKADPYEVHNLIDCALHQDVLERMRAAHRDHIIQTRDVQFLSEAEMHRRAKGTTTPIWKMDSEVATSIYDMAQDPQRYPVERIFAMAELAAERSFHVLPMLEIGLTDDDPAIRYWAAMGILIRGMRAFKATESSIRESLNDVNPSVQVIAAEILATFGTMEDRQSALRLLVELARPDEQGVYVALEALNTVNNLGEIAMPIETEILENAKEDPRVLVSNVNEFIIRLLPGYTHPGNTRR